MSISVICIGFVAMLVLMFLSMPVAVAILTVGGVGGYLAYGMPLVETMGGVVWGTLNNPVMTAIPLFMLLGELLLRGGIADKMFDALAVWLGKLPGDCYIPISAPVRSFPRPLGRPLPQPQRLEQSHSRHWENGTIRCALRLGLWRQAAHWASLFLRR